MPRYCSVYWPFSQFYGYLKIKMNQFKQLITEKRFLYANESLTSDAEYSSTPQINVDEGPSDQFKDKRGQMKKVLQKAKKDEAKAKKQEAPDKWVRLIIYLAFSIDIGGEGTIEEALHSISAKQREALDAYVRELQKLPSEVKKA